MVSSGNQTSFEGAVSIRTAHRLLRERLIEGRGVVMVLGAPDTGKTTFAARLAEEAVAAGRSVAYVDADIGHSTFGPPACVGLRWIRDGAAVERSDADELRFVGATSPQGVVLPHVVATAALVDVARRRADLVVLDTTGTISGVVGQTLKYHKAELCQPMTVVALARGGELDPIVGMLRRFLHSRVQMLEPDPGIPILSPIEHRAARTAAFEQAFAPPLQRWRVHPSVFAPTLPEGFDLSRLDQMLVGLQDDHGGCLGLGALAFDGEVLRVVTNGGENMQGLRLGSMRINLNTFETTKVRLRQLIFGI